ncbi:MarR family winged helix-turn-helix transcriptional regulator [Kitasatospora sp. NPDC088134]|uniref:MarR family winged helix-turn-helix transcriptional regulator n=1 Tax=Kitasatospora sp. NPDC088134 TaxID=3364071 RepID=UPI0038262D1D
MFDSRRESSDPFEQPVHLLAVLARESAARIDERLAARGSSRAHHEVLTVLHRAGPHGRADLAAPAAVLDDLLARGLVRTMAVQLGGGRQEVLLLTPAGESALADLHADAEAVQDGLMVALSRGERAQLGSLLRRMHASLGRDANFGSSASVSRKVRGRTPATRPGPLPARPGPAD